MGWIEDEVDVLVVEVEDEVDREGLGSSSPRFMPSCLVMVALRSSSIVIGS